MSAFLFTLSVLCGLLWFVYLFVDGDRLLLLGLPVAAVLLFAGGLKSIKEGL